MAVKKTRHRITKRALKTDRFVESTMEFVSAARHHAARLAFIVIAFLAVVVIVSYFINSRRRSAVEAEQYLTSATASYMNGDFETARDALEDVQARFWGTRASSEALFLLGNTYYALKDYEKATQSFEQFLRSRTDWTLLKASAQLGIGNCLEQKGQLLQAAEQYQKVANDYPASPLAPEALLSAARCYQAMGQALASKPFYERLKKEYPNASEVATADVQLKVISGVEQAVQ
jgi:TolA-binding protein